MKKIAYGLILTLLIGVFSSFGMMSVAAVEEIGEDEDVSVLLDVDFTQCENTADLLNIPGIELSGLYELGIAPDGTTALKLCKDGADAEDETDIATPGTMVASWDNGHTKGFYKIQIELYNTYDTSQKKQLMQQPITFMDIKDTAFNNGEGLDITRIAYDQEACNVTGMTKVRVYANILAGIWEDNIDNYLTTNGIKDNEGVGHWFSFTSTVDTESGECSAVASVNTAKRQTRSFEDLDDTGIIGNFAPNQVTTIASSSNSEYENDMYIKRILVTGPEGEPTPIVPVTPPDYEITALNLTDADGAAAELGTATKIGSVAVNRASHIEDKEYTVLVVEYKDNVFSRLHIKKYEPAAATTEGDMSLQLSPQTYEENTINFDEDLSEGTTSVKVMLWNSFDDLAPIAKVYK